MCVCECVDADMPMACDGSYTVVIVPLQNSLYSLDALRFFNWLKTLRALEREKDSLYLGLQVVEQARVWYQYQLEKVPQRHIKTRTRDAGEEEKVDRLPWLQDSWSCALRSRLQRANGSLGSLLTDVRGWCTFAPNERGGSDWDLRRNNAALTQEVSQRNRQISVLEFEKEILMEQWNDIHYV